MVSDHILAPDFFGPQKIWSLRNLATALKSHVMIFMRDSNFFGTKFLKDQTSWGPNFSGTKFLRDQMRLWTFSAIAIFSYIYRSVNSRNIWFGLLHIIIILKYSYVLLCILMVWGKMINVSAFHIRK